MDVRRRLFCRAFVPALLVAAAVPAAATAHMVSAAASTVESVIPTPSTTPPQSSAVALPADGCTALVADLPNLAATEHGLVACVSTSLPVGGVNGDQPAPSWCATNGGISYTRTESCGVFQGSVSVFDTQSGALVGQIFFNFINYSYTSTSIQTWAHQLNQQTTSEWGAGVGSSVSGVATCSASCTVDSSTFPSQPVTPGTFNNGDSFFDTTATAPGAIGTATTNWAVTFTNPAWVGPATYNASQLPVRCDNALPGSASIGCVFPDYVPAVTYQRTGPYPLVAQHIADAQSSGLRGNSYTNPISRLIDANLQAQNRATACPSSLPRPPGDSCDEYPFASTYQGAALSGGGPRTFPYCAVVLVTQSTGANGYSVCMLPADQNSGAGSILGAMYLNNRVLDGDDFWVQITT